MLRENSEEKIVEYLTEVFVRAREKKNIPLPLKYRNKITNILPSTDEEKIKFVHKLIPHISDILCLTVFELHYKLNFSLTVI